METWAELGFPCFDQINYNDFQEVCKDLILVFTF